MKLRYINFLKGSYAKELKQLYINSFPKNERYPFWLLKYCAKGKNIEFNCILNEKELIGFEYLLKYKKTIYIMYLAIDTDKRNKGYGSLVIKDLLNRYNKEQIILCTDRPDSNINNIKLRRKNFYLRNGFYSTNKYKKENGVEYEILCTDKNFEITKNVLENLYKQMTDSLTGGYFIGKIFNVYNVNFIE